MADLEDFFAKRDKKKKKAPKFEAESVAKILEKKRVDMSKSSYQPSPSENSEPISEYKAQVDDDEWREAVEEKPDYTGLKIQDLALEYSEEEDVEKNIENESQQDGPWKRAQNAQGEPTETSVPEAETPAPPAMPVSEVQSEAVESSKEESGGGDKKTEPSTKEELSKEEAAPVKKGYVPPHLRKAQEAAAAAAAAAAKAPQASVATRPTPPPAPVPTEPKPAAAAPVGKYVPVHLRNPGATPSSSGAHRPKKAVPNVNDEELFPSLGC